ncbi:MAG: hypothetical protein ACRD2C_17390 [Acidimicrobiales bacterium]
MNETRTDLRPELRALRVEVSEIRSQLRILVTAVAGAGALGMVVLVGLSLWAGSYREVSESGDEIEDAAMTSLAGLPGQASDAENGVVQLFAVLTIVALLGVVAAALAMLGGASVVPSRIAVATLVVVWIVLRLVVSASGEGGSIDDLGVGAAAGAWWPAAAALWAAAGTSLVHRARS